MRACFNCVTRMRRLAEWRKIPIPCVEYRGRPDGDGVLDPKLSALNPAPVAAAPAPAVPVAIPSSAPAPAPLNQVQDLTEHERNKLLHVLYEVAQGREDASISMSVFVANVNREGVRVTMAQIRDFLTAQEAMGRVQLGRGENGKEHIYIV